eukprot:gene11094-12358_t
MGLYLSTPSTEVTSENGSGAGLTYALGEMQGWRRHMEDAHVAFPELSAQTAGGNAVSVFGVFDGHGGKEVAKFVHLKYAEVLTNLESFKQGDYGRALRESFHKIDQLLEDPQYDSLLQQLRKIPSPSDVRNGAVPVSVSTAVANSGVNMAAEKSSKEEGEEDADLLSREEAARMIRDLIRGFRRGSNVSGDANENEEEGHGSTPSSYAEDDEDDEDGEGGHHWAAPAGEEVIEDSSGVDEEKALKGIKVESSDLWVQTTLETAIGESAQGHHVTPHVDHDIILLEEGGESGDAVAASETSVEAVVETETTPAPAARPVQSNNMVCRLAEHRVQAGCTAVVALVVDNKLIVANAGDSRGVLCRKGEAVALSEDHKPQQARELTRIQAAGGFVSFAGRVNGNLNLSRSLGDLKYKQNKSVPPEGQMITAEPDIAVIDLCADDQFFILACDGVWDCLTNQQACDFVSTRLASDMPFNTIIEQILHSCLADEPRRSEGIGADNMTCLIVDLRGRFKSKEQA